jgi:chaperone BCS1
MEQSGAGGVQAVDAYRKALATAASATAYAVMARSMARELLPPELRAAARWASSALLDLLGRAKKERRTLVVRSQQGGGGGGAGREENLLFDAARTYLASKLDPRAMPRLGITLTRSRDGDGRASWRKVLFLEPGDSTVDVFDGVTFEWACVESPNNGGGKKKARRGEPAGTGGDRDFVLELRFAAEHTDVAVDQYVPFVMKAAEEVEQRDRALKICMNEGRTWYRVSHHHPATFDTLAMDRDLKRSIVADLDLFASRRDHYRRIGKAWKRGYLLYGPPGTGKSSLVAAMANHLRYDLYDLDLSHVHLNASLQWLLVGMPNRSILVIEDIDCCCDAAVSREDDKAPPRTGDGGGDDEIGTGIASDSDAPLPPAPAKSKSKSKSKNDQVNYSCLNHKVLQS